MHLLPKPKNFPFQIPDTSARCTCTMALANSGYPRRLQHIGDHLQIQSRPPKIQQQLEIEFEFKIRNLETLDPIASHTCQRATSSSPTTRPRATSVTPSPIPQEPIPRIPSNLMHPRIISDPFFHPRLKLGLQISKPHRCRHRGRGHLRPFFPPLS